MNTYKKKPSLPAAAFTAEDIKQLREYVEALDALKKEEPKDILTWQEWDDFWNELHRTGEIPEKYKGRISENEIEVKDGMELVLDEDGNPVLDEDGNPKYRHIVYDTPQKRKAYYDTIREAHNKKLSELQLKYKDIMWKAFLNVPKLPEDATEEESLVPIMDLIRELLKNPVVVRELEKEAGIGTLAPFGSIPNGDSLNWLYRVIAAMKGGRMVHESTGNRHEIITTLQKGDSLRFIRENKQTGSTFVVEITQADKYLQKTNKTFTKVLLFALQKMTAQNNPLEIGFSLQELVDLGMYENTSNARRAVKAFFEQQKLTTLSGSVKKGRKTVKEEGGVLFYHYKINNGFVTLSVNENFNLDFIANYFTIFPRFAYALSNNAFALVRYIFFLARQNTQAIKDKGTFNIGLEAVRENLGLPSVEDVKNRKYRQFIIEPIEKAIEEVEEALQNVPEAKEYGFTITPCGTDPSNIKEWLQGFLEIGLNGDFAETFIRIATKAEKDRTQWEKVKQAELARIAAREEAKEAKEAKKTGKTKKSF